MNEYQLLYKLFYKDKEQYNEIYKNRINSESTIKFNVDIAEQQAFCVITPDILKQTENIYININKINFLLKEIPKIAQRSYIANCLKDEIMMTNKIEGIHTTRKQIDDTIKYNEKNGIKKSKRLSFLVEKYSKLLHRDKISFKSAEDIRKLYDELLGSDIPNYNILDGDLFRKDIVNIETATGKIIHKGIYPEKKLIQYINTTIDIINDDNMPTLVKIAVVHYLFGYIHPFYDGNGRTSRFISSYMLKQVSPLLSFRLSYIINENKSVYYKAFENCNDAKNKGDLTPFVIMFLDIIENATLNINNKFYETNLKLKHYSKFKTNITPYHDSIIFALVQDYLFGERKMTQDMLCQATKISKSTLAKCLIVFLEQELVVREKYGRNFVYHVNLDKLDQLME